jgi:hypothetical protein
VSVDFPVHPTRIHPLTGAPLQALGRTKRGQLIWPVLGASQPTGEPQQQQPAPVPTPAEVADRMRANPQPIIPPPVMGQPNPHPQPVMGVANNAEGYPEGVAVVNMAPDQQAAYWKHYARRNEERINALMTEYPQLKEQAEAYKKHVEANQTEHQRAVVEAEQRGRKAAMAEAGGHMVEAYVRAAAAGRMSEEQVSTLLQGLDRNRFVNPATGQVDAQMVSGYIGMLAPAVAAPMYATGGPIPVYPPLPGQAVATYPPQVPGQPVQLMGGQVVPAQQPVAGQQQWSTYPVVPGQQPPIPNAPVDQPGRQVPHYGQGQYPQPQLTGIEAGRAIARQRFANQQPRPGGQQQQ